METWIVTVEFENVDSVAVETRAEDRIEAQDKAYDWFLTDPHHDRPTEADAVTVAEFEESFGKYEPGMFVRIG